MGNLPNYNRNINININNMSQEKKEEVTEVASTFRKIIIETDGNKIKIAVNETAGILELKAVLTEILANIR